MKVLAGPRVVTTLCVVVLLAGGPRPARAQRLTGELSGTVVDGSGAVIPGAAVTLVNRASGSTRETVTNHQGFFAFSAVPASTYRVTIALSGFKTYERTDIELLAGDSRTLRKVTLELGGMEERVTISSEIALTPVNSGEKTTTLTAVQIENVPMVGRNAAELLKILPGATPLMTGVDVFNHPTPFPDEFTSLTLRFANGALDDPNGDFGRLPDDNKVGRRIVQIAVRYSF